MIIVNMHVSGILAVVRTLQPSTSWNELGAIGEWKTIYTDHNNEIQRTYVASEIF